MLSALGWPAHCYEDFLKSYKAGNPKLPKVEYEKHDLSQHREALTRIAKACDVQHPVGRYIEQTAGSYVLAARMLEGIGKPEFHHMSVSLYGRPTDKIGKLSNLTLADDFITVTSDFSYVESTEDQFCVMPAAVVEELQARANEFFTEHKVAVVLDKNLASKAAAGAERVRIRGMTSFSRAEIDQLLEHELFVHSASMLNGRRQPYLKSLGLGAPRTTGTQEGLATFAELITATMDLSRLRRIALRIKAIHIACEGADFIQVFKFFQDAGQSEKESFQSAARIFRGGDVRGRYVFTKDCVYLKGLVSVHAFLRKSIELRKIDYPRDLFIGRLTLGDVVLLEDFVKSKFIAHPLYLPRWVKNRDGLAAYLSYSLFTNRLRMQDVKLADFIDQLDLATLKDQDTGVSAIA